MLPITMQSGTTMPQLPESIMSMFKTAAEQQWGGLGSVAVRRLKVEKLGFSIGTGADKQQFGPNDLVGVCIAMAPCNHCVWYERDYAPGMEPAQPDLVWVQKTDGYICPALPEQFHHKINRAGSERWAFQTLRRTIWAFFQKDVNGQFMLDLDNPVVYDISSASLYGKSYADQNLYKWTGIIAMCKRLSVNGAIITPAMFPIQICLDGNMSIGGVTVFRPALQDNRYPQFLDQQAIIAIADKSTSVEVQDMLNIREKLEYGNQDAAPVQPRPIQPQPAAAPAAAPAAPAPQPAPAPQNDMSNLLAQAQAALAGAGKAPAQPEPHQGMKPGTDLNAIEAMLAQARS